MNGTTLLSHPRDIASFVHDCLVNRTEVALVFVTSVEGGSVRAPGLRMAIAVDGRTTGFVSNGCVEADLIATARDAMALRSVVTTTYGRGSGKIDLALPCGGRIDVLIVPADPDHAGPLQAMIGSDRITGWLVLRDNGGIDWHASAPAVAAGQRTFAVHPKIRLIIFGAGAEALMLARLAAAADMQVEIQSPDELTIAVARDLGLYARALRGLSGSSNISADSGTAIALLFHDHEWEQQILVEALASRAFYIGALGSHRAHLRRMEALAAGGLPGETIARIKAPIGLVHQLRDPNLLAVSALAEIAQEFQKSFISF